MSVQRELAEAFGQLHIKGQPVVLFNVWDAGTAKSLAEMGAKAIATGSWSVAASHGYGDGEQIPIEAVLVNLERIVRVVDLPVTLDFEGGYAAEPDQLRENITRVLLAGAVGINFEDQVVGTDQLYDLSVQSERIQAIRETADEKGIPLFINARTDLFLKNKPEVHASLLEEAIERARAFADAGASSFFAPALVDPALIKQLCEASPIPINILIWPGVPTPQELAELGVARISYGSRPYFVFMEAFKEAASEALSFQH